MIPLFHDFDGERVLIFGGGSVGARKARRFAREAETIVVSPTFADVAFGGAERIRAAPDESAVDTWLDRTAPALVVAATDDESLNGAIETAVRKRGILLNRADQRGARDAGSVVVPATIRQDPVVLAIATGGQSPAVSRVLRERLENETYVRQAGEMARITSELRKQLQETGVDPDRRQQAIREVVKRDRVWKALDSSGSNTLEVAADVISDVIGDTS
ncbi:bifunctional precorrin-2 dehydrogenase/sirohydrochlorin ferrochelatase [Halorhabdus sp. CUG00001]|uniref:precorrin-2 dehydrogenase/sirohydrochlorin ferrochelatase family protein n=1 Tax=Halorhabdus sp. CUG00001 TaxID=2600297 RepID=UPI00131B6B07|nr:bifunctional precorrin-2 dehydrogenase/sirohydrochlorin ferrochelatase [Halorhabdus sp. CUG00001]